MVSFRGILSSTCFLVSASFLTTNLQAKVGEKAHYLLDNGSRTSSLFSNGFLRLEITGSQESEEHGTVYNLSIDYKLSSWLKNVEGHESVESPEKYMTEEFINEVREKKTIITDDYKIEHLGIQNRKDQEGNLYENCDIIRFYDINIKQSKAESDEVRIFLSQILSQENQDEKFKFNPLDLNDVSIVTSYHPSVPVSGAVTVDLKAKYHGWPLKAGFDYAPSHEIVQIDPDQENKDPEESIEIL